MRSMNPEEFISRLLTDLGINRNCSLLEIACKNTKGELGKSFSSLCEYFGVDEDIVFIDKMKEKQSATCSYFHMQPDDLKFQNNVFNVVFIVNNGRKIDNSLWYSIIKEAMRVSKHDGKIGIYGLNNDMVIRIQAYCTKHFHNIETKNKESSGMYDLIITRRKQ